tara:strand:- start:987 stop:1136 length:150 start_codon:yes stop_codon:yes gene_type:complete
MKLDIAIEIIRTELESACDEFYGEDCKENEESKKEINDAFKTILDNLPK